MFLYNMFYKSREDYLNYADIVYTVIIYRWYCCWYQQC